MKEHVQEPGVRKYAGDDLIELQSEPLKAIQTLFKEYPPCVVQGCEIEELAAGVYTVKPGLLSLKGVDAAGLPCHKLVPFQGATDVVLPAYFTLTYETQTRVYGDGKAKPIAYNYKAILSVVAPAADIEYLQIASVGAPRWVDVLGVTKKLDREGGQAKDVVVNYATPANRNLPASGAKLGVLLGLITKWFTDLKALAFKEKVEKADLDAALQTEVDNKVVKIEGKGLSANDYTTIEKEKLAGINTAEYRKEIATYNGDNNLIDPNTVTEGLVLCGGVNCPTTDNKLYYVQTMFFDGRASSRSQIATSYTNLNEIYIRNKTSLASWTAWQRLAKASELYKGGLLSGLDLSGANGPLKGFVESGFDEYGFSSVINYPRNALAYFTKKGGTVDLSKSVNGGSIYDLFSDTTTPLTFNNPSGDISITLNLPAAWSYMKAFSIQFAAASFPTKFSIWYYKNNQWTRSMLIENNTSNVFAHHNAGIPYDVTKVRITAHAYNSEYYQISQIYWANGNYPSASYALPLSGGEMYGNTDWKEGIPKVLGSNVLHAGNTGHGNGLNADLLDGKHAADFALANDARLSDARNPLTHSHSDYVLANDWRLSNPRNPLSHSHDYELPFSKNTAFNKNFEANEVSILNWYGVSGAKLGKSNTVARGDHTHGMPNIATSGNFGFMSASHAAKVNSLFTVIAAGGVAFDGAVAGVFKGVFSAHSEQTGIYWVEIPGLHLAIVNANGNYNAFVYNKGSNGFNVRILNPNGVLANCAFTFAALKF